MNPLSQKKRLIRGLIEDIEVRPGVLALYYLVHEDDVSEEAKGKVARPSFRPTRESAATTDFQNKKAVGNFVIPTGSCRSRVGS